YSQMIVLNKPAAQWNTRGEVYFRLLLVPGILALTFAALASIFPRVLMGNHSTVLGLLLVTAALFVWRIAYAWLAQKPYLREKVYVLGMGERAQRLVQGLRSRA